MKLNKGHLSLISVTVRMLNGNLNCSFTHENACGFLDVSEGPHKWILVQDTTVKGMSIHLACIHVCVCMCVFVSMCVCRDIFIRGPPLNFV